MTWHDTVQQLGFGGLAIISLLTCWTLLVFRASGLLVLLADLVCVVSTFAWLWSFT